MRPRRLIGIGLFLTHLAKTNLTAKSLRASYPDYAMIKDKMDLSSVSNLDALLEKMHQRYLAEDCTTIDGLKIDFPDSWVHLRKSNTEPIVRIYAEAPTIEIAQKLVDQIKADMSDFI